MAKRIGNLNEVIGDYDVVLSDVWGVVHNGVEAFQHSCKALAAARDAGATVVLITNSPRTAPGVIEQMRTLGVPDGTYDRIVTSGDVTQHLIVDGPKKVFLIGPERDLNLFDGLGVEVVSADEASRDVEAWLKCYFIRDKLGEEFSGVISGVAPFGIFVQLDSLFIEGLVHVTDLGADYFQYDDVRHELRGERTGIRYQLTDRVTVQVSRVDLDARKIDLRLVTQPDIRTALKNETKRFEAAERDKSKTKPASAKKPATKASQANRTKASTAGAKKARTSRKTSAKSSRKKR